MAVSDPEERPDGAVAFDAGSLAANTANRVLVLYLEHEPVDLKSCLETSCDNKGRNITVNVRALLVKRSDLTAAAAAAALPVIHRIPRLHTKGGLQAAATAAQITQAFRDIVSAQVGPIGTSIEALFSTHAAFLSIGTIDTSDIAAALTNNAFAAQYQYDGLLDVAAAYHEAAAAAYALVEECCPIGTFPRHLMLGTLDGSGVPGYRNEFQAAPIRNVMHGDIDRVRALFDRLRGMAANLHLDPLPAAAVIRPSHTAAFPLGRRAHPYYFASTALDATWRPRRRGTADANWPWVNEGVASTLDTDYAEDTFLRIEGHVQRPWSAAYADLIAVRHAGNAEFDLLCSFVDDGAAEEQSARAQLAGVRKDENGILLDLLPLFEDWVATGTLEGVDTIAKLAVKRQEDVAKADAASTQWLDLRARRALHCDTGGLATGYLQNRNSLLCGARHATALLERYTAAITALPDAQLTGPGLQAMITGSLFTLARRLAEAVIAIPADWNTAALVKERLADIPVREGTPPLREALLFGLQNLKATIDRMAQTLPRELSKFDYDRFAHLAGAALARSREMWAWMQALGAAVPGIMPISTDFKGDPLLDRAEAITAAADWLGLHGCLLAPFATLSARYEAVRAADVSLFRNLVAVDGLEHLAGVSKGGTFVLVADKVSNGGTVVADLSLDGRLPCCCNGPADVCVPPIALPDVRVIRIDMSKQGLKGPLQLAIDVMANDSDPNGPPPHLAIEPVQEQSDLGARLEIIETGTVHYTIESSALRPGMIDRFQYGLTLKGTCTGQAIGTVAIVVAAAPVINGDIRGIVLADEGKPAASALVSIKETSQQTTSQADGSFTFRNLAPGTYTLSAVREEAKSDEKTVTVHANETTDTVDLLLKTPDAPPPTTGTLVVTVTNAIGAAFAGASVAAVSGNRKYAGQADAKGVVTIGNVQPATYTVTASSPGYFDASTSVAVTAGQTARAALSIDEVIINVAPGVIRTVATHRSINVLDASANVRTLVVDRFQRYVTSFNKAGDNPAIAGAESYKAAADFMTKQLMDPAVSDDRIAEAYKKASAALAQAANAAPDDQKDGYRQALTAMTAAYLDRVSLSSPSLSAERAVDVKEAADTVKSAGVPVADVQAAWNGGALHDSTGLASAQEVGTAFR
jgi:hypothetical protein